MYVLVYFYFDLGVVVGIIIVVRIYSKILVLKNRIVLV